MHLYLIRHADALDGSDDAARPLSPKGRKQIVAVARLLRESNAFEVGEIWHSPLVRAHETAVLLAEELKSRATLSAVAGLTPEDPVDQIAATLGELRLAVAVVGHEPHLSALASLLVAGQTSPARFTMKKCAVLRLDRTTDGWSVRWQVSPELV